MIFEYDSEQLDRVLADFYEMTHLSVSIWDADFHQLGFQPKEMPPFCKMIRSKREGLELCRKSDMNILRKAGEEQCPQTHICHAGLCDTAVPIIYDGQLLGYLIFGQIKYDDSVKNEAKIKQISSFLKINEKKLSKHYDSIAPRTREYIDSASRILYASTAYLWLSEMIKVNKNYLPAQIDLYIKNHIAEKITVEEICREFYISKNKMYRIFDENFGCTLGQYILKKRLELAVNLIKSTDEPIYEIAPRVGISDYNYFIKVFKKEMGVTPLKMRKTLHFD